MQGKCPLFLEYQADKKRKDNGLDLINHMFQAMTVPF